MKRIAILGSTGSIGINTLEIVKAHPKAFSVKALAAKTNAEALYEQARAFRPEMVCLYDKSRAADLEKRLKRHRVRVVTGEEGLCEVSTFPSVDQVIVALVGAVGLRPLFAALRAHKILGVANKEPLVIAGQLLMKEAKRSGVTVLPIDSEHSGLWQCLEGREPASVKKLILTSSGGPFRKKRGSLAKVTPREALRHPKWRMGPKITIDSATLMNKGLEVIEAANLFAVPSERIEVLIHPEAVVHALVEFVDGTHLAHLGITDMRPPIQYALSYPHRLVNHLPTLDLARIRTFHFELPDRHRFPCLELGFEASRIGGTMPAALNAANEIAVQAFLEGRTSFLGIPRTITRVLGRHRVMREPSLPDLLATDRWAREEAQSLL